jgi:hypothetical protein
VHSYECPFGHLRLKVTAEHNQLLRFCSNAQPVEISQLTCGTPTAFVRTNARDALHRDRRAQEPCNSREMARRVNQGCPPHYYSRSLTAIRKKRGWVRDDSVWEKCAKKKRAGEMPFGCAQDKPALRTPGAKVPFDYAQDKPARCRAEDRGATLKPTKACRRASGIVFPAASQAGRGRGRRIG